MKAIRLTLLCTLIALFTLPLQAEKVSVEQAKKVAQNSTRSIRGLNVQKDFRLKHTQRKKWPAGQTNLRNAGEEEVMYYVFDSNDNQGFVIVAGDDVAVPVLGYSDHGSYDENHLNLNFQYYMDCLAQEIAQAIDNRLPQSTETKAQWEAYSNGTVGSQRRSTTAVTPLLQTQWNQDSPYWDLCPSQYLTGCVATAMAQVMKYHNHPIQRTATIPSYTTRTNGTVVPAITGTTNYDWASMTNGYSASSSQASKTAVATLMFHCGASVQMDYTTGGSGAYTSDVGKAFMNYFGYDKSLQYKQHRFYSNIEWETLLKAELDASRPIFYAGSNPTSGHAFVCDGYDADGYFHFNWGWGSYLDGYFLTTALNPGTGGAGAGAGTYNESQGIVINVKPDAGGEVVPCIYILDNTHIVTNKNTVDRGEIFTVNAPLQNAGMFSFSGDVGVVLVSTENDQIISVIGQNGITSFSTVGVYTSFPINCFVPASVSAGNYRLKVAARPTGSSTWTTVKSTPGYTDVLNLEVTSVIRTHGIKVYQDFATSASSVNRGQFFNVSALVVNFGSSAFTGDLGVALVNPTTDQILEIINFDPSHHTDWNQGTGGPNTLSCVVSPAIAAGQYKLRWIAKPDGEDWSIAFGNGSAVDILDLTVNDVTEPDESNLTVYPYYEFIDNFNTIDPTPSQIAQNSPLSVNVVIRNIGTGPFIGDVELALCNLNGDVVEVIGTSRENVGRTEGTIAVVTVASSNITSPRGTYHLSLFQKSVVGERKIVPPEWEGESYKSYKVVTVTGIPPLISTVSPANEATGVPTNGHLVITFDKPMNTQSGIGIVTLDGGNGTVANENQSWTAGNTVCTVSYSGLEYSTTYTFHISGFKEVLGNVMDAVTAGYSFTTVAAPATTTWSPQGTSTAWNDVGNWTLGVPGTTSNVVIPGSAVSYPVLNTAQTINEIEFKPGAEIGRQDLLTHTTAKVDYKLVYDRWYLFSVPLQTASSEPITSQQFHLNYDPDIYMREFTVNGSNAAWKQITTLNKTLPIGSSIALNADKKGEDPTVAIQTSGKLAAGNVVETLTFGGDAAYGASPFAIAGNPFMTTIDFGRLATAHSGIITGNYLIWNGENYIGYTPSGPWGTTSATIEAPGQSDVYGLIAPLQSFIVESATANPSGAETLTFNIATLGTDVTGKGTLRSSESIAKLDIIAANATGSVLTFIADREGGQNTLTSLDARKLFSGITNAPDVYTLKASDQGLTAVGANIIHTDNAIIPIGIATQSAGKLRLTFKGMDSFNTQIALIDQVAGQEIPLTGDSYTQEFDFVPAVSGSTVVPTENRFFIRLSLALPTDLNNLDQASSLSVFSRHKTLYIFSNTADLIKQVLIYNLNGQVIETHHAVNATTFTTPLHADGVYIGKIITEKGTHDVKIVVK